MNYRVAGPGDARALALLHLESAKVQPGGFMHKLGPAFLVQYYRILLGEKHSLVVLAEDNGAACGFHSGTSKAEEHHRAIRRNRGRLALALVPAIIRRPRLALETLRRFQALQADGTSYRVTEGPRGEYWAWRPGRKDPVEALRVLEIWHQMMKARGVPGVRFEVDLCNRRIAENIGLLKAEVLREVVLPDGRKRLIMEIRYGGDPGAGPEFLPPRNASR